MIRIVVVCMKALFHIALLSVTALSALAQTGMSIHEMYFVPSADNPMVGTLSDHRSGFESRSVATAWSAFELGQGTGFVQPNGQELGEDTVLAAGTSGRLDDFGFTLANQTGSAVSGNFDIRYTCYNSNQAVLFRRTVRMYISPLFPLEDHSAYFFHLASAARQNNDFVPGNCQFSTVLTSDNIPGFNDLEQYYGPLTIGSSDPRYHNYTSGQDTVLPDGQALYMQISTIPVPAPAALATLLAALPMATRRRR